MWRCENCRKENRDDRKDCWNCSIHKELALNKDVASAPKVETVGVVERPTVCAKCSAALDEDSKFCPKCAAPVLLHSRVDCPKCRKTVDASAKFCKFCAADLTQKSEFSYLPESPRSVSSSFDSRRAKADKMVLGGGCLAGISALAFFWGVSYTNNTANQMRAGFGSLVGQTDATYGFAKLCVVLGLIGAIAGIVLLIVGLSQRNAR